MEPENSPRKGILVFRLPADCQDEVLDIFREFPISSCRGDSLGFRIIFQYYESTWEILLRQTVQVRGESYDICPLVTNLTIWGIGRHVDSRKRIKELMKPYGKVFSLHVVKDNYTEQYSGRNIQIPTGNYRVILDVPEVQAGYYLDPIVLPEINRSFPVSFFCRLCRDNGHKQYECQNIFGTNRIVFRSVVKRRRDSFDVHQSPWHESDGSEVDSPSADFRSGLSFTGHPVMPSREFTEVCYRNSEYYENFARDKCSSETRNKIDRRDSSSYQERDCATICSRPFASNVYHSSGTCKNAWRDNTSTEGLPQSSHLYCKDLHQSTSQSQSSTVHSRKDQCDTPARISSLKRPNFIKREKNGKSFGGDKCSSETRNKIDRRDSSSYQERDCATICSRPLASNVYHSSGTCKNAWGDSTSTEGLPQSIHLYCKDLHQSTSQSQSSTVHSRKDRCDTPARISSLKRPNFIKREKNGKRPLQQLGKNPKIEFQPQSSNGWKTTKLVVSNKHSKDSCNGKAKHPMHECETVNASSKSLRCDSSRNCNSIISIKTSFSSCEDSTEDEAFRTKDSSREVPNFTWSDLGEPARKRKARQGVRLSLLTPPDIKEERMSQLIRRVYLPAEMSRDVVRDLEKVVRWINRRGCPTLRGKEGDLKRQLEQYLDQVNTSQTEEGAKASDDVPDVSQSVGNEIK